VDHGLGDVNPGLVVAHESALAGHPAEGVLYDPASGQDLKALLAVAAVDELNDKVLRGRSVHQRAPVVGPVGEQVLAPRPSIPDHVQDDLLASQIRDVGRREIDHQRPPVGIDRDGPLKAERILAGVLLAGFGGWRLGRLVVEDAAARAGISALLLSVDYQGDVAVRGEQVAPHQGQEPRVGQ
jgi:hypothetical protein